MIKIIDGKIKQLPKTGIIDGKEVINYHLLEKAILVKEGWLDRVDVKPAFNATTHYLTQGKIEVVGTDAIINYVVVEIPEVEPSTEEVVEDLVQVLSDKGVIF